MNKMVGEARKKLFGLIDDLNSGGSPMQEDDPRELFLVPDIYDVSRVPDATMTKFHGMKELFDYLYVENGDNLEDNPELAKKDVLLFLENMLRCINGVRFLEDNGLVLSDISVCNIGINSENNKSFYFDFDFIYQVGDEVNFDYALSRAYLPPELGYGSDSKAKPQNMVFQLGVVLRDVGLALKIDNDKFDQLVQQMCDEKLDKRISLTEAQQKLQEIIDWIKANPNANYSNLS